VAIQRSAWSLPRQRLFPRVTRLIVERHDSMGLADGRVRRIGIHPVWLGYQRLTTILV
jgi:hypothetical protein